MSKNNGGPAFPRPKVYGDGIGTIGAEQDGMTLRDWFAGHANENDITKRRDAASDRDAYITREQARYMFADAMLAERERE